MSIAAATTSTTTHVAAGTALVGVVAAVVLTAVPSPAAASTGHHYYLGHGAGATHCLYVGPSWDTRFGSSTVDYATLGSHGGHNLQWAGPAGSGWRSGHALAAGRDRSGHPTVRAAARTAVEVSGGSTVVFRFHKDGHSTVTSHKMHPVSWMTYAKAGCPTE